MSVVEFVPWSKTPRYFREIVVTEKIDGTNAAIVIEKFGVRSANTITTVTIDDEEFDVYAQSRKRLITPTADNFGFAAWVRDNAETLVRDLGEGRHFGEWWGQGIQRGYGLDRKVFSLFNTSKWYSKWVAGEFVTPDLASVPVLYRGTNDSDTVRELVSSLPETGSWASLALGVVFDNPEGVCVYHSASNQVYKVTVENDESPKSLAA